MHEYHIEGGFPIKGSVKASGNKNAALPCIAAAVLTSYPVTLKGLPEIEDVAVMFEIFQSFGGVVKKNAPNEYTLRLESVCSTETPSDLAQKLRASILFAGPLLARSGRAVMPPPGGDVIGRRRLDTHFLALTELGAQVKINGHFVFTADKLIGQDIFLDEASVTATENAVMAAATAEGDTIITNAASEPHIQDLCNLLNAMGAHITGIGSNILTIHGVPELHGAEYRIGADYMEVGSFIGLAAVTHSSLSITNINPPDMRPIKPAFDKLGIRWDITGTTLTVPAQQSLKVNCDLGGMIPKIDDAPWPGFPADLTSIMTVIATQVDGTVLIHEKMFESRMFFVDKLIGMGARITLCDPHRAVVTGPSTLHASELVSPDVRAGMALVIAACCARGESLIRNVYQIERGYERLVERFQSLGIHIERKSLCQ